MRTVNTMVLVGCVVSMLAGSTQAEGGRGKSMAAKVRIGTYDSRSVAIAFAGSEVFNKRYGNLPAERDTARAAGDQKRIAELEAEGAARQELMHKQGFSTAPVDNILEQIKDKLPAIKEKAGLTALVSKWDKAALAEYKDAEFVDVTMALVDALNPNDRQRRYAIDIQKEDPIPLSHAENIKD